MDDLFAMAIPVPAAGAPARADAPGDEASEASGSQDARFVLPAEPAAPPAAAAPSEATAEDMLRAVLAAGRDAASRPAPPGSLATMHPVDARRAQDNAYKANKKAKLERRRQAHVEGSGTAASRTKVLRKEAKLTPKPAAKQLKRVPKRSRT